MADTNSNALWTSLSGALGNNKGGWYGTSFYDQYSNAQSGLNALNGLYGNSDYSQDELNKAKYIFQGQKAGAVAGGITSGLGALGQIAGIATSLADIEDTPLYDYQINQLKSVGQYNYNSYDQIANAYNNLGYFQPDIDYDKIRGGSTGQRIAGLGSAALSGASAGLTIGGPWGALIGAGVGLIGAGAGWIKGSIDADRKYRDYTSDSRIAQINATENLGVQSNKIADYQFRAGISNRAESGGQIERRSQTLLEFSNSVLRNKPSSSGQSSGIIRKHCKGGTMIRIKR